MDIFSISFSMKVYCVLSLESPHRGSIMYQFLYKKKATLNSPKSAAMEIFEGTQKRVQNSRVNES